LAIDGDRELSTDPVIPEASAFLEPAAPMPVSAQVGSFCWDDHEVANAGGDSRFAPWTLVRLDSLIRLHGVHDFVVEACEFSEEAG
jgi:hypothetical protein